MTNTTNPEQTVDDGGDREPERYELDAERTRAWEAARAEFFALLGGGIVVACALEPFAAPHDAGAGRRGGPGFSLPHEIGPWLHIAEDGAVTGYTGKVEFGQNIRTSLTEIIADELPVPREARRQRQRDPRGDGGHGSQPV